MRSYLPTLVTAVITIAYVAFALAQNSGDVGEMLRLGLRERAGELGVETGYDGQFVYFFALDPNPAHVSPALVDVPAYRYQRILLSLLAWLFSFGQAALVPWALIALNVFAHVMGTFLLSELLARENVSGWWALVYGLWVGELFAVRLALTEPLAYALVLGALLAGRAKRETWAAVLLALSLFAKEVTLLFIGAYLAWLISQRAWRAASRAAFIMLAPFAVFQLLLFYWFGRFGLGSGGAGATGFEIIPYMGLWRIGFENALALLVLGLLLVPAAVFPSAWGVFESFRRLWRKEWALPVWLLLFNAAFIIFTPFSTFRELLGMVRLLNGLLLAVLLFGAWSKAPRVLRYSTLWLVLLLMLANETR